MKRREFIATSAGALAAAGLAGCDDHGASRMPRPPAPQVDADGTRRLPWQNWSGYQHCLPKSRVAPRSEDELATLLREAKHTLRPVGAGHSFTPLVPTEGTIISLRNFEGLKSHDPARMQATLGAGTKLGQLGPLLDGIGQALPNMPDIDEQSLAGAMATATHGTGAALGAMHAYLASLRLVTPQGEVLDCSRSSHADIFDAARVSLGALGVITEVTLDNVAAHKLKRRSWIEPIDTLIERFDELAAKHYSFEIYYVPFCSRALAITIDPTEEPVRARRAESDNDAVMQMKQLRDWSGWWPGLRRRLLDAATQDYEPEEAVDVWYRVFPSERAVRFNEMEYHLPREHLLATLKKVRARVESQHNEVFFPIEVRVVKGDDAWLSPFGGHQTSGSIAVHGYYLEDPLPYFASIEPLYQDLGGRPHWGKMNTLEAAAFAQRYPRWRDFLELRATLDPEGKMLNPYLKKVFGLGP